MFLIKWDSLLPIDDLFADEKPGLDAIGWDLAADVYEDDDNLYVDIQLPGIKPDTYEISFREDMLHVEGKRETETETSDDNFYRKEIQRGSFERNIKLPDVEINEAEAKATHENGVLKIAIPKK